ncbi:putative teichoic acid/polysaccharide export protein [Lactococcus lactis subsp. lactis IO-1]|nr:putative teichoic acid/polysaccharide export protein [Lactococcus lactis subsp. lactis IO-1]
MKKFVEVMPILKFRILLLFVLEIGEKYQLLNLKGAAMSKVIRIGTNRDVWSEPSCSISFHEVPDAFPTVGDPFVKVTNKVSGIVTWVRLSSVDFINVKEGSGDE